MKLSFPARSYRISVFSLLNQMQSLPAMGTPVSSFSLLDQNGRQVSLNSLLSGAREGCILVFFASTFLKGDIALLKACQIYVDHYPQQRLAALSGVNWESQYLLAQRLHLSFPLLFDACCRQSSKLGVVWAPKFVNGRAILQVDSKSRIVYANRTVLPFDQHSFYSTG
jgi:peroxiredoxin